MIKEHIDLFKTLLAKFEEDSECLFFCNVNEEFEKLWFDDSFKQEMLEKALMFTKEFYPEKYKIQKEYGETMRIKSSAMFQYGSNDNKIRVEFLNWLIPQL